eukprot:4298878-Ditylum_brightwellii.AAC.1
MGHVLASPWTIPFSQVLQMCLIFGLYFLLASSDATAWSSSTSLSCMSLGLPDNTAKYSVLLNYDMNHHVKITT